MGVVTKLCKGVLARRDAYTILLYLKSWTDADENLDITYTFIVKLY